MQSLPEALQPFAEYRQFILYKLVFDHVKQKNKKIPVSPFTRLPYPKGSDWQKDPQQMTDFATASANCVDGFGVGFIFTPGDPFFFVDIDHCYDGGAWSPLAIEILGRLSGAAVEVSSSNTGLHIFGRGLVPPHSNKNIALGLELYTEWRFVALTGTHASGDASQDCSPALAKFVADYFPPKEHLTSASWTSEPNAAWNGPTDDDTLIEKMLGATSASAIFGGVSNFKALWTADADALAKMYPDERGYDASSADAALAQHLAFWTGSDCDRMLALMYRSALVRDKWTEREEYLTNTILHAVRLQTAFYCEVDTSIVDKFGAGKIDASSEAQREFAERIRATVVSKSDDATATALCQTRTSAKFWLDNQDKTPEQLAAMLLPVQSVSSTPATSVETVSGYQYLGATLQLEKFAGCAYIQDIHRIFTPRGTFLKPEQFNAMHGGFVYQLDERGEKTTRKAWEAFTESQVIRFPKADTSCFRPEVAPGAIVDVEGLLAVNTYVPIETPRVKGDIGPFMTHLNKLLPDARDRSILLAYMAACVQHKGVKFQWAPVIQGAPGNGKTLFTRVVSFAVGSRYTHYPKASDLTNKFNHWLLNKLFIGVEDIYVTEARREVLEELKPMITGDEQEIQQKGGDQFKAHICANFILNSNHRDAVRKTTDDRRFAVFFTKQQTAADIIADGMGGDYFPDLYKWLNDGGYSAVNEYLHTLDIPEEFNPATKCHRAPETSSTAEAVEAGLGSVEQEILEAIAEGRTGFAGGFVSSVALERLLRELRAERAIPQNRRRDMMASLGYDWHPALNDGRVNAPIGIDDNKRPRLYVKIGHAAALIRGPADVAFEYQRAQGAIAGKAEEVFGNVPKNTLHV